MVFGIHKECTPLLEDEERVVDNDCFDDLDNRVCVFKRKTLSWMNSAHEELQSSRHSSRSSRSWSSIPSKRSSESRGSRSCKSSNEKEVEGRVKMTGLMTEAQYVEQRKQIENQAEMLKIKLEIAKKKPNWKYTAEKRQSVR